jgi:hypothetical protein
MNMNRDNHGQTASKGQRTRGLVADSYYTKREER